MVHSQVKRPLELSSLYDDLESAAQSPTTQVLHNAVEPASAEVAAALGIAEGSGVHRVERLRLTHGRPVAALCNYIPEGVLDVDTARLESTGLYRMMRAVGITLHSARQSVGAALLTMQRTAYDDSGRAVEYGTHIYRSSRYAFEFQLLLRT